MLLLAASLPMLAQSQQYRVSELTTQKQLPVATVRCVLQDGEGYMWYGTANGGVCRDDGYRVNVFRSDQRQPAHITNDMVNCLAEDQRQGIWVGTDQGLCRIDKHDYSIRQVLAKETGDSPVSDIVCAKDGSVWVAVADKLLRTDAEGIKCERVEVPHRSSRIIHLAEDSHGSLWITQTGGFMSRLDPSTGHVEQRPWSIHCDPGVMVEDASRGGFWVSTWGEGIVFYEAATGRIIPQEATHGSQQKREVLDMMRDHRQGLLWVTTMDNLYVYRIVDGARLSPYPLDIISPSNKIIDQLAEDSDGNMWVAGFIPHTFIVSADASKLERHDVAAIQAQTGFPLLADRVVADGNHYWIWQGRTGLHHYTPATGMVSDAGGLRYSRTVSKCLSDSGVWTSDGRRVCRVVVRQGAVAHLPVVEVQADVTALSDDGRQRLWIGTSAGICCYSLLGGTMLCQWSVDGAVTAMACQPDGVTYFLTSRRQLLRCSERRAPEVLLRGDFTSMTLTPDGQLWLSTTQGEVLRWKNGTVVREELACDERGDAIKCLESDDLGHIWTLTDQRVKELNPQTQAFRTFDCDNPFVRVSYFYHLSKTDGHHICVGGAGAFCVIPSSVELNQRAASARQPRVSTVELGDTVLLVGYGQSMVEVPDTLSAATLSLTTLDHLHADHISFAYMLEGWNRNWVYLSPGSNTIHLSNLPKGDYRLLVKATDRNGNWSEPVSCLTIRRLPSWYETWWARLLFVVLVVLLVCVFWLLRHRIAQLVALQKKRREIVIDQIELNPDELEASRIDNRFLQQAVNCVEQHIDDSDFSVEQFSSDMCMSRMNLYRRLQALTGQTPSEFVRDLRLKKAAQLLGRQPDLPVNEVAARVGFATPSYFTKCFKRMFGVLPTEYGRPTNVTKP